MKRNIRILLPALLSAFLTVLCGCRSADLSPSFGERNADDREFVHSDAAVNPDMIGIDPANPKFFSFGNGDPFYPIGQNVCWSDDYEPYFKAIHDYHGNIARVWICPWNNPLLELNDFRKINLVSAANIDRIFQLAAKYGVCVQLVMSYHGSLGADWEKNPFNKDNGGPCAAPEDFWTNNKARAAFKQYLSYAANRWASLPNLFAWELMNEADLTPRYKDKDIVNWHREMGNHLKAVDPCRHLVTTSLCGYGILTDIWRQPAIDFCNSHFYDADVKSFVNQYYALMRTYGKPYFICEFGRGLEAEDDRIDADGQHLHHTLWLAWMTPSAGNALPWWWDTYIKPNKLQYHFAALAAFNEGENRGNRRYRCWAKDLSPKNGATRKAQGLISREECFGFVYDPERIRQPASKSHGPVLKREWGFRIDGMPDGNYKLEIWDTCNGVVAKEESLHCTNRTLTIPLPPSTNDFAFKLKRVGDMP